ncbi:MAG: methylmalonyl Co-A mutase-associated GTPase MeaB [Candidatus Neomarinimicrobiota bacterium]|nr:MAG: methylmalonyl Co-A mutase-associated GTPase MeaB [Candidatus Neomarinimicrobiota bacterium]
MNELVEGIISGNTRAISKAISLVENDGPDKIELLKKIHRYVGESVIIGITGPPGAGKSSLINVLIKEYRKQGKKVGILAIDPTSPFTGGALLGDRLRMQDHSTDENVFIRSLATRGHLGGISPATSDAVKILDAAGFEIILLETVGVGQAEIEIVEASDIVLLVLVPGYGDEIQVLKAGIIEIGDIYVINKADQMDATKLKTTIEYYLELSPDKNANHRKVVLTSALTGSGVDSLIHEINSTYNFFRKKGILNERRKTRIRKEILRILNSRILESINQTFNGRNFDSSINKILNKKIDPYTIADSIFEEMKKRSQT